LQEQIKFHHRKRNLFASSAIAFFAYFFFFIALSFARYSISGIETGYRQAITSDIIVTAGQSDVGSLYLNTGIQPFTPLKDPQSIMDCIKGIAPSAIITPVAYMQLSIMNNLRDSFPLTAILVDPATYCKVFDSFRVTEGNELSGDPAGVMVCGQAKDRLAAALGIDTRPGSRLIVSDRSLSLASMREIRLVSVFTSRANALYANICIAGADLANDVERQFASGSLSDPKPAAEDPESVFHGELIDMHPPVSELHLEDDFFYRFMPAKIKESQAQRSKIPVHSLCIRAATQEDIHELTKSISHAFLEKKIDARVREWHEAAAPETMTFIPLISGFAFIILLLFAILVAIEILGYSDAISHARQSVPEFDITTGTKDRFFLHGLVSVVIGIVLFGSLGILAALLFILFLPVLSGTLFLLQNRLVPFTVTGIMQNGVFTDMLIVSFACALVLALIAAACMARITYARKPDKTGEQARYDI
jgi:hypothetical protein